MSLFEAFEIATEAVRGAQMEITLFLIAILTHHVVFGVYRVPSRSTKAGKAYLQQKGESFKWKDSLSRKTKERTKANDNADTSLAAIKAAAAMGNFDEANAAFQSCRMKSSAHYNSFLDACVSYKQTSVAERVVAEAQVAQKADGKTFHTLMKAFLNVGDFKAARKVIDDMRSSEFTPSCTMFNEMLDATVLRNVDEAWRVMDDMAKTNVKPTRVTCSILLKCVQQASSKSLLERTLRMVDDMTEEMDEVLFCSVIEACIRTRRTDLLLVTLKRQQTSKCVQLQSSHAYGSVIRAYGVLQDVSGVWATWREMQRRRVDVTSITLGCMVESIVTNTSPESGYELIQEVSSDPLRRPLLNAVIYGSVLKGFSHQKQFDRMWAVYQEMLQTGVQFTVATYNAIVDACARCNEMNRVASLLKEMVDSGIKPNIITYSAIIKGYCQDNRIELALGVMTEMQNSVDLSPDEHTYNTVINGCARRGLYDKGMALLEQMCDAGIPPSNFTLSVVVKLASRGRQVDKAFELVDELSQKFKLRPNVHVYNNLIQACTWHKSCEVAMKVVERMAQQGVRLDVRSYSLLLKACVEWNEPQQAADLLRVACGLPGTSHRLINLPSRCLQPQEWLPVDLIAETLEGVAKRGRVPGDARQAGRALAQQLYGELKQVPIYARLNVHL